MMKLDSNDAPKTAAMPAASTDPAKPGTTITLRGARASDLHAINNLIASAIATWQLADRVKRISLPLYRYHDDDLRDMQLVVAHSGDDEFLGVAALERAYATDIFDGLETSVLHGIYVAPLRHRNGVGSRLLEAIENMARAQGTEALLVKARPEAISFFNARGFEKLTPGDRNRDYPYQFYKILSNFDPA
jgi:N-acetylglutamate synthase-like GNAT family acetyltransferase